MRTVLSAALTRAVREELIARNAARLVELPEWRGGTNPTLVGRRSCLGSQLGAYAHAGSRVILMVGHHKLVHDLGEGLGRASEYSLPREHARMQAIGRQGSLPAKTFIISYTRPGLISASPSCRSLRGL
jgi:hypothetical protein